MLVLSRQSGESFHVGDHVEVRVLEVSAGQVKIGIVAPREIEIYRSELAALNRRAVVRDWRDDPALDDAAQTLRHSRKP